MSGLPWGLKLFTYWIAGIIPVGVVMGLTFLPAPIISVIGSILVWVSLWGIVPLLIGYLILDIYAHWKKVS